MAQAVARSRAQAHSFREPDKLPTIRPMSSAVEATALATPPPGVPPGLIPGTPDLYATTGPYGLFRFDPGRCDVSDWLGPGTDDDEGSAAVTDGSDADKSVPSALCRRDNSDARACPRPLHAGPPQGDENSRRKCRVQLFV